MVVSAPVSLKCGHTSFIINGGCDTGLETHDYQFVSVMGCVISQVNESVPTYKKKNLCNNLVIMI